MGILVIVPLSFLAGCVGTVLFLFFVFSKTVKNIAANNNNNSNLGYNYPATPTFVQTPL